MKPQPLNYSLSVIEDAKNQFTEWRLQRKNKREPIPDTLKKMAVLLCRDFPCSKVAKILGLNASVLKTWQAEPDKENTPSFIELKVEKTLDRQLVGSPICEFVIDSERGHTVKVTFNCMPSADIVTALGSLF